MDEVAKFLPTSTICVDHEEIMKKKYFLQFNYGVRINNVGHCCKSIVQNI